ncbi:MAG: fumarylacetoacetate hydrolase family protein [Chloroflexota bacterium]|nr:fumarylacetoacetate hydrolase family protein [Chloroflexota bacterium]
MRLVTIRTSDGTRAARLHGDQVVELEDRDVGALLAGGPERLRAAEAARGAARPLAEVDLAPVIPRPPKVICVGQNYLAHIQEMGSQPPEYPTFFAKFTRALIGPRDPITLPAVSDKVDWEVELAIVMGREARHVAEDEALAAVAGYTILNDISVRDYQRRTQQWLQGKTFEGTTPVGPALVTADEVDPSDLALRCEVDGQVMQDSRTSDLLFKPADLIAYISTIITLEPGDIIATGTPSGVGAGRTPPVFLQPGQTVRTVVEGLGELVNPCVKEER